MLAILSGIEYTCSIMNNSGTIDSVLIERIDKAIHKGIDYLYNHQFPNGEFICYISGDDPMQGWNHPDSYVFPSIMIACSLLPLKHHPVARHILTETCKFIQYQMHWTGIGHYFTRLHKLRNICPYDADDTAYGSYVLREMGFNFPESLNKKILLDHRNSKGLFYTWFTLRLRWNRNKHYWRLALPELARPVQALMFWYGISGRKRDIDAGVNANVLYYMGETKETQPVIGYLIKIIEEGREGHCDKWYRYPVTMYYLISRNYRNGVKKFEEIREVIINRILATKKEDGRLGESAMETAFAVSSLIYFHYEGNALHKAVEFLTHEQKKYGDWPRWRVYFTGSKRLGGYGSEEMTTAFCLEALALYRQMMTGSPVPNSQAL